jgi:nucleoside-diphosphate-sugar epimerase
MNILVTGSSGFLGMNLKKKLAYEHNVFTLSRNGADYNYDLSTENCQFNNEFDLVIHAAGKAHILSRNQSEIDEYYNVNVVGTRNLLSGLEKSKLPLFFVFISSVSVYGIDVGMNIDEEHSLLAKDAYGMSKIEAERIVLDWCENNNILCSILRLPLIVGPNPTGNLMSLIKAIQKGYYFNIGGGLARRSMVLVDDIADYIVEIAKIGGIFNLTDGYHPSLNEISNLIAFQLGKSKILIIPFWFARVLAFLGDFFGCIVPLNSNKYKKLTLDLVFDDTKAKNLFNWQPRNVLKNFKIIIDETNTII